MFCFDVFLTQKMGHWDAAHDHWALSALSHSHWWPLMRISTYSTARLCLVFYYRKVSSRLPVHGEFLTFFAEEGHTALPSGSSDAMVYQAASRSVGTGLAAREWVLAKDFTHPRLESKPTAALNPNFAKSLPLKLNGHLHCIDTKSPFAHSSSKSFWRLTFFVNPILPKQQKTKEISFGSLSNAMS